MTVSWNFDGNQELAKSHVGDAQQLLNQNRLAAGSRLYWATPYNVLDDGTEIRIVHSGGNDYVHVVAPGAPPPKPVEVVDARLGVIIYDYNYPEGAFAYIWDSTKWRRKFVWNKDFEWEVGHSMDVHRDSQLVAVAESTWNGTAYQIDVIVSKNGGATWQEPVTVYTAPDGDPYLDVSVAISPDARTIYIGYGDGGFERHEYISLLSKDSDFQIPALIYTSPERDGAGLYYNMRVAALTDERFLITTSPPTYDLSYGTTFIGGSFIWEEGSRDPWIPPELVGSKTGAWVIVLAVESGAPTQILPTTFHAFGEGSSTFTDGHYTATCPSADGELYILKYWEYYWQFPKTEENDHWILTHSLDGGTPMHLYPDGSTVSMVDANDPTKGIYVSPAEPSIKIFKNGLLTKVYSDLFVWPNTRRGTTLRTDGFGNWVYTARRESDPDHLVLLVSRDDAATWAEIAGPVMDVGIHTNFTGGADIYMGRIVVSRMMIAENRMKVWVGSSSGLSWRDISPTEAEYAQGILNDAYQTSGRAIDTCFIRQ